MATFQVQIEDMVGIVGSSADTSSDTTAITSWLTDGAKEVINVIPPNLLALCASEVTLTPQSVGSESSASLLNTGKVFNVRRSDGTIDQPCRLVSSRVKGRVSDSDDMMYATATDPVYYIESNYLNILPSASSAVGKYSEVQYPTVNYGDSSISATSLTGVTATAADPTVFTKSSHGLVDGDIVHLSGFSEMTEINGMTGTVNQLNASTFEVNGISADPAETTGGNVVKAGGFPDEASYLVVLYAAIKAVERIVSDNIRVDEDVELANAKKDQYTWLQNQYMTGIKALSG